MVLRSGFRAVRGQFVASRQTEDGEIDRPTVRSSAAARTPLSHNSGMKNMERAFAERPEILAAWVQLNSAIKARMDLRRYELATLAAARRLRSSYCCLAHGTVFLEHFDEPLLEIARDHRSANLSELDVAVMDLAERVVDDATSIGDSDTE